MNDERNFNNNNPNDPRNPQNPQQKPGQKQPWQDPNKKEDDNQR